MTDRERMIEVIMKWDQGYCGGKIEEYSFGSSLADRLIEAGFGVVKKEAYRCPICGNMPDSRATTCPHMCHSAEFVR